MFGWYDLPAVNTKQDVSRFDTCDCRDAAGVNVLEDPVLSIRRLVGQVVGAECGPAGSPAGSAVKEAEMRCMEL